MNLYNKEILHNISVNGLICLYAPTLSTAREYARLTDWRVFRYLPDARGYAVHPINRFAICAKAANALTPYLLVEHPA